MLPPTEAQRVENEHVTEGDGTVSLPCSIADRPTANDDAADAAGAAGGGMNDSN